MSKDSINVTVAKATSEDGRVTRRTVLTTVAAGLGTA